MPLIRTNFASKPLLCLLLLCAFAAPSRALQSNETHWSEIAGNQYTVMPDVVYGTQNNYQLKLDLWRNNSAKQPVPTVIYIHGGGWVEGDKDQRFERYCLPFIRRGMVVANIEYRLARSAPAQCEQPRRPASRPERIVPCCCQTELGPDSA